MDSREERKIKKLLKKAKENIVQESVDEEKNTLEMFEILGVEKDKPPHPINNKIPEVSTTNISEYKNYNKDRPSRIIGIDASTTKTITMGSEAKLCISNCRIGINRIGDTKKRYNFEEYSNISMVLFKRNLDVDESLIEEIENELSEEKTHINLRVVSDIKTNNADQYLDKSSLLLSESDTTRKIIELNKKIPNKERTIIFLDGPIYPLGLIKNKYLTQNHYKENSEWKNKVLQEIVNNYKTILNESISQNTPVIGCVKNIDTTKILTLLKETNKVNNSDIIWHNDESFLTDLLHTDKTEVEIGHTNWFEEKRPTLKRQLSSTVDDIYEERKYKRIHFYLKLPQKGSIIRIETIKGPYDDIGSREMIKKRSLAEVSKTKDLPKPIDDADCRANIDKSQANKLRKSISNIRNYNKERGYD